MRRLTVGLLSVAAVAAGFVLLRQHREVPPTPDAQVPPGETQPATISLERLRALGY